MSSFELDRNYEGPSSVGIEMYLETSKNNNADTSSVSFDPVDMIDPSVLDPITAYSMRPSNPRIRKRWDEVHPMWVKCDTNLDLAWRPDEFCKCGMTTPKVLLIHSKDQSMIVDPDPQSKRWCAKFPDHEPPAKPGVCSEDTDQTYAGSGKDSTSNSCEGRGMCVCYSNPSNTTTTTTNSNTKQPQKSYVRKARARNLVFGKRIRMESVFVWTRLKVEVKEMMVVVVVVEVVPGALVVDPEIMMSVKARVLIEVRVVFDHLHPKNREHNTRTHRYDTYRI